MSRTQWILAGLLALQVLLLVVIRAPLAGGGAASGPRPFLPVMESFTPTRIQITEGTEDEPKSVVLQRKGDGWELAEDVVYPAAPDKVDQLLDDLKELKVRRPVVSSGRYHTALKVTESDHERRLRLWEDASDDPEVELFLGTSPNYRVTHARLGGEDEVYELRGLNTYDLRAEPGAWVEKKFLDIPFDDVTAIKLSNEHGGFELKREEGEWGLVSPAGAKGGTLDPSKVDSFVRSLASLWLSEPAGRLDEAAQGFDEPAATVEIAYNVGAGEDEQEPPAPEIEVMTLRIGGEVEDGEGKRYASRSGFDYAVVLSKYDAEKATQKTLADLYEEEEEEE